MAIERKKALVGCGKEERVAGHGKEERAGWLIQGEDEWLVKEEGGGWDWKRK